VPEIFSTRQLSIADVKVDKTGNSAANPNRVLTASEESHIRFTNPDMFTSAVDIEKAKSEKPAVVEQKEWQKTLIKKSVEVSESIQKNMPHLPEPSKITLNQSPTLILLSQMYSRMVDPFVKIQEKIDINKQKFIDISDKLAAIYGEKEKDLKDKLSDVFKRLILKPFNLISEVDTSMGQNEHNKERKIKNREPENQSNEIDPKEKKFSLKQWINYKLLEITGEILNLSRRFTAGIKEKHNIIKKGLYKGFKKVKEKIVFTLDKIDSLIDSK